MSSGDEDGRKGGWRRDEGSSEIRGLRQRDREIGGGRGRRRRRMEESDPRSSFAKERFERGGDGFGRGAPVRR